MRQRTRIQNSLQVSAVNHDSHEIRIQIVGIVGTTRFCHRGKNLTTTVVATLKHREICEQVFQRQAIDESESEEASSWEADIGEVINLIEAMCWVKI